LRLLRLVRAFASFDSAAMHVQALARHRGFAWLIVAWLSIMVVCSAFVYQAEHGVNKLLASPFDALWWGVTTLTTVGYGDTYPVTQDGRLGAMSSFISQQTPSRDAGDRVVERLQAWRICVGTAP
jgi:voltage-gated potassium channel